MSNYIANWLNLMGVFNDDPEVPQGKKTKVDKDKYEFIVNSSLDLMTLINNDYIFEAANTAYCKAHKLDKEDIIGKSLAEVWGEDIFHKQIKEKFDKCFDGEVLHYESNFKMGNTIKYMDISYYPYENETGDITHVAVVSHDVTDYKLAEQALRENAEKLESANKVKSNFLATMSHELRTPMNAIIGMTNLVLDSDVSLEQREFLEVVKNSADSLLNILNDILDFSKIEAGKMELENIPFDLRQTIESTLCILVVRTYEKNIELISDISPEVPHSLLGDPGRFRQIIMNLIGNAIKFTEKGEISVHVTLEKTESDEVELKVSVTDTGIGIPKDKLNRLFQSFSQVDNSTSRKYGGSGLGLMISKNLIEMMDGQISVESEEGKGSNFFFSCKLKLPPKEDRVNFELEGDINKFDVLILDEFDSSRVYFDKLYKSWGFQPHLTSTVNEAISYLEKHNNNKEYHIVLINAQSETNHFKVAKKINNLSLKQKIKSVILTTTGARGDGDRCKEFGVSAYLLKPLIEREFFRTIEKIVKEPSFEELITRHVLKEDGYQTGGSLNVTIQGSRGKKYKILVVEDNAKSQQLAKLALNKIGWSVISAWCAQEAIDAVKNDTFDAILMDIKMPDVDGLEATKQIRKLEEHKEYKTPIIGLSAKTDNKDEAINAGMEMFIEKPFNADYLCISIQTVIDKGNLSGTARPQKKSQKITNIAKNLKLKILLTEDNKNNQMLGKAVLKKQGYEVASAWNGKESYEMYQTSVYDLILMDMQMPEMDGIEATKAIREYEQKTGKHIPIVGLTANAIKGDRERCIDSGMDEYMTKPFNAVKLNELIEVLVNKYPMEQES